MRALARAFLFMASAVWLAASSAAQTVNIHYRFTDFQTNLANVSQVSITPIPTNGAYNALLSQYFPKFTRGNTPSLTNGEMTLSNVLKGRIYRTTFTARGGDQTYDILVGTNLPDGATIDAWTNIVTGANDTVDGFAGYSQAAANAKFLEKSNGTASALSLGTDLNAGGHSLTNVTDVTDANGNSLLGAGSGSGEANVGANIGTGVGIYAGKSGLSLNLRSVAASGGATVFTNATTLTISADAAGAAAAATNGYPWGALYDPVNSALAVQAALAATNAAIQAQVQASNTVYRAAFEVAGAANAATNSLYSTLNAKKVDAANGVASNLTVSADATQFSAPNQAALMVVLTGTNINGMNVSALSSTNELTAAGYHAFIANTNGNGGVAFDMAGWSPAFGSGYGGTVGLDIYNTNAARSSATSNLAPNFVVSYTDGRDSGIVTHHSILGINATNLNFELYYYTNASSERIPGFKWDGRFVQSFHTISSTNFAPLGTVSGSGTTITGTGTRFGNGPFNQAGFGDIISVGTKSYHIMSVASDTSVAVTESAISPTFTGSNYIVFKAAQTWYASDGVTPVFAVCADGSPMIRKSSDGVFLRMVQGLKTYELGEDDSGNFFLLNASDNSIPFTITTNGNATFAGKLTANGSGLTNLIHGPTVSGASGVSVALTQNSDGSTNYALTVTAGGSGTVTSVDVAQQGFSSSGAVTGSGTVTLTRSADANFLGFGGTNVGYWKVGGTAAADTMTVTNGITNLSLTASTLLKADANKKFSSIANGAGVLTNDASGNFGYAPLLSASALGASQYVATDANTNLVSTLNGNLWTNLNTHFTNYGTVTNIVLPSDGNAWTVLATNGPHLFLNFGGNNTGPMTIWITTNGDAQWPAQVTMLGYSNHNVTNCIIDLQPFGGTNRVLGGQSEL